MEQFIFTPDNIIENIKRVGPWSAYGLASSALQYYFPDEYDEDGNCIGEVQREIDLCRSLGCTYWQDVIIKFEKEIGYNVTNPNGFHSEAINEY